MISPQSSSAQSPTSPTMRKRQRTLDMHSATSAPADGHPTPTGAAPAPVGDDAFINDHDAVDSGGEDDDDDEKPKSDKKAGRRKIKIEFIQDKSRRHITFSKRKAGKALSSLLTLLFPSHMSISRHYEKGNQPASFVFNSTNYLKRHMNSQPSLAPRSFSSLSQKRVLSILLLPPSSNLSLPNQRARISFRHVLTLPMVLSLHPCQSALLLTARLAR